MLRTILSIAGRPGLYRLVNQGKNMLIVENLADGRRTPAYARDKVVSLGDISIYTLADDKPLPEVLEALKVKADGKTVDIKALGSDAAVRDFFGEVLPEFDRERVNTSDIKKLIRWYNLLTEAGMSEFVKAEEAPAETSTEESAEEK